jgi:quercetin dioxygenase-like cupin family protein
MLKPLFLKLLFSPFSMTGFVAIISISLVTQRSFAMPINPAPVELIQIDKLPNTILSFGSNSKINSKLIVDKNDFVAGLYELRSGQEISKHASSIDKAFYVLEGTAEVMIGGEMKRIGADDSLFIPRNSATQLRNPGKEICKVFFFYTKGPFSSIKTSLENELTGSLDLEGKYVKLVNQNTVPFEDWDGVIPVNQTRPMTWKTLIDNSSMVVGNTIIHGGYDVKAHFHTQSQIIIFSGGEGKTRILGQDYQPLTMLNAIYVPTNSVHHTIAAKDSVLKEIYFFPEGPFSTIEYNIVDPISEKIIRP